MKKLVDNIKVEQIVLSRIIEDAKIFDEINSLLTPDTFTDQKNRIIFTTILKMYNEGKPIDKVMIMTENPGIDEAYLLTIEKENISSESTYHLCLVLQERWMLRRFEKVSKRIKDKVDRNEDVFDIMKFISQEIYEIENHIDSFREDRTIWGEFNNLMQKVEDKYSGKISAGLECTSFPTFNNATGGIMPSDLIVVYGKDKSSKTTFTERLVLDFAFKGIVVGVFPMEMDFDTYSYKALSMEGNIEYLKLRNPRGNKLEPQEFKDFYQRAKKFSKTKIIIDDLTYDFDRMLSKARLWKRKHGVGLFVFDYLGLIKSQKQFERRDLQLSDITGRLKNLAKELQTPIIVVSQANEERKTADGKGAMRDGDFAIYLCKPKEDGIKSIKNKTNNEFIFDDNHFLATIERSRHGKAKQNMVCGFVGNDYREINIEDIGYGIF